jgi:hypothetical protein
MQQPRVILLEQLRGEIREYGITRLTRETGFCRQHVQRIAGGQRKPSARFLALLEYQPITFYRDLTQDTNKQ